MFRRNLIIAILPGALGTLLLVFCKASFGFCEKIYAKYIFPLYRNCLTALFGGVPFSVAELLLLFLSIGIIIGIALFILRLIRHSINKTFIIRSVYRLIFLVGVLWTLFVLGCGGGYYRSSVVGVEHKHSDENDTEELYDLCMLLSVRVNSSKMGMGAGDERFCLPKDINETLQDACKASEILNARLSTGYCSGRCIVKRVIHFRALSYLNITGVFSPFTAEANVNVDIPEYSIASTACHEIAHSIGFMREEDANMFSFLACTRASEIYMRYSGYMMAFIYCTNTLYKRSKVLYRDVMDSLCTGAKKDLQENSQYWSSFKGQASELSEQMNDYYLKANGQETGAKSYELIVEYLLDMFRSEQESI